MKICMAIRGALALALMSGCVASPSTSADTQASSSRVQVLFDHPDKFLDIRDGYFAPGDGKREILAMFRDYITRRTPDYLPEGDASQTTFINIKLAGVLRIGGVGDRRVVSATTPPMFMFDWAITDSKGRVVRSSREKLEESDFKDLFGNADEGGPHRHEKAVLDDWTRNRLET